MQTNNKIDELVDKAINEALEKSDTKEELKKRRPKPFRILHKEEIKSGLSTKPSESISFMKENESPQIVEDNYVVLGLGDIETIENVLKKHKVSKKS